MDCQLFVHCVVDKMRSGLTPHDQRWKGLTYDGPFIPLGAMIEYKPSSKSGQAQLPSVGRKTLPGIFLGYGQRSGGSWNEELLIADKGDLAAAHTPSIVPIRRFKAGEVWPVLRDDNFQFPLASGTDGWSQPESELKHLARC